MKCTVCGKETSEFSDGYCLRCEKIAVDVDAELAIGVEVYVPSHTNPSSRLNPQSEKNTGADMAHKR